MIVWDQEAEELLDALFTEVSESICDLCFRAGISKNYVNAVIERNLLKVRSVQYVDRMRKKTVQAYEELLSIRHPKGFPKTNIMIYHCCYC